MSQREEGCRWELGRGAMGMTYLEMRGRAEVTPALKNMVEAARRLRYHAMQRV